MDQLMENNRFEKMNIQWFPGHMTKAQRMIEENLKLVDAVCEILDARIPRSSRNPDIDRLAGDKPRLVILNRIDLADPQITARWKKYFEAQGLAILETDARSGKGVNGFAPAVRRLLAGKIREFEAKGQVGRPLRVMILGIPNVGKSTFINKVAGRKAAIAGDKPRLVILNRTDLADPTITARWRKYFEAQGMAILETDARTGKGVNGFAPAIRRLLADKIKEYEAKGQVGRPLRVMILGIPNVGKSTFINKVAGRKAAIAGDKPGVTRGKQWINIDAGLDLLDTPGILWPRFDSQEVGEMLAITNAIKADVLDKETLAANFMLRLRQMYPQAIVDRYKFQPDSEMNGFELLEQAAKKRGFLVSRGEYDIELMANTLLGEYHDGKLGRLSLEAPDE